MKRKGKPLVFLVGQTASGKSAISVPLAESLGGEILSMDSMAVYKRMDIGTAKPSEEDKERVAHHLIDIVEPWESFDAATYREMALEKEREVYARGKIPLFVGGTPFYFMILTKGLFHGPGANPEIRSRLFREEREKGEGTLHRRLEKVDPASARKLHPRDLKRVIRALEVYEMTGRPISELQKQWEREEEGNYIAVGIQKSPGELKARITRRVKTMLAGGLVEETRSILEKGGFSKQAGSALGYAQVIKMLNNEIKPEELEQEIVRKTWYFSRKQRTWFKKFQVLWADPSEEKDSVQSFREFILSKLDKFIR